jgi:hypothetical protein
MSADLTLAAEEHLRDLPVPPFAYGLIVFAILAVLLVGVLMFGKGRPHS